MGGGGPVRDRGSTINSTYSHFWYFSRSPAHPICWRLAYCIYRTLSVGSCSMVIAMLHKKLPVGDRVWQTPCPLSAVGLR